MATLAVACFTGVAHADVATVPADGVDPWSGGALVTTPLESAAGAIASRIAGRPVSIRCEGDGDWQALTTGAGFESSSILGYVSFWGGRPLDFAELSPDTCRRLEAFAAAAAKPTKCVTTATVPQTTTRTVRKRVRGRLLTSIVRVTTYKTVAQPAAPCFAGGRELTANGDFWSSYFYTSAAIQTLVHESQHLKGDPVEAEAECYGMQWLAYAAQQLGDTPDDAAAIAQYYATRVYPLREKQTPEYWSSECRAGGALDLASADPAWPGLLGL
jgi:hypothetical protein